MHANKTLKKYKNNGFSMVELMINFVIISCIIAAFSPVITRRIQNNALGITNYTVNCTTKFNANCNFCNSVKCISCKLTVVNCPNGVNVDSCTCK